MVTFLIPTIRFHRSISSMPSISRKGYRWGRTFWISLMSRSIVDLTALFFSGRRIEQFYTNLGRVGIECSAGCELASGGRVNQDLAWVLSREYSGYVYLAAAEPKMALSIHDNL